MRLWFLLTGRNWRAPDEEEWDVNLDAIRRNLVSSANDGIVSAAAIIQGLLAGGASWHDAVVGVIALITIGVIGSAASRYSEAVSERKNKLAVMEAEQKRLQSSPQAEFEELVEAYRKKGLSKELSHAVASELNSIDPLKAQLEIEYAIDNIPPRSWPWKFAALSGLAFFIGATLPMILLLALPWHTRGEVTLLAVVIALTISGWIGSYSEHSNPLKAIFRTVFIGVATMAVSTLAGMLVRF